MTTPTQTLEHINTSLLVPYARNSRTHSPEQVQQVANSIKEFGFTNPVLIDGDNGIIAGHGRVMAAQSLGLEQVPCIRLDYLTEAQKRAYIITDNQLALNSAWDKEVLALELDDLAGINFDLGLLGFDDNNLIELSGAIVEQTIMPSLRSGDREPFQQMTFTLHDTQVEQVQEAIRLAKTKGAFVNSDNQNGNGNALARICETYITKK